VPKGKGNLPDRREEETNKILVADLLVTKVLKLKLII
jgi:hypothetical protein